MQSHEFEAVQRDAEVKRRRRFGLARLRGAGPASPY